jgi:hypothetical protein
MEGARSHLLAHGRTDLLDQGAIAPSRLRQLPTDSEMNCGNAVVTFGSPRAKMRSARMARLGIDRSAAYARTSKSVIQLARLCGIR